MALHWRAPVAEPLGTWLLRSAEGFTHRANSVLAAGLPGLDLGEAVARARAWYAARGRPALAALPRPFDEAPDAAELAAVAAAFAADGWRVIPDRGAFVLTAATAALAAPRRRTPPDPPGLRVRLAAEPDAGWLALYHYRGEPLPPIATTAAALGARAGVRVGARRRPHRGRGPRLAGRRLGGRHRGRGGRRVPPARARPARARPGGARGPASGAPARRTCRSADTNAVAGGSTSPPASPTTTGTTTWRTTDRLRPPA